MTSPEVAKAMSELAVLSSVSHGNGDRGQEVLLAMLAGILNLSDDLNKLSDDMVFARLLDVAKQVLRMP